MPINGIAEIPLMTLRDDSVKVQKRYADNGNVFCSLDIMEKRSQSLKNMVLLLVIILPSAISLPTNLFTKKTQDLFVNDEVERVDGCRVLGSVIVSDNAQKNLWRDH